MKICLLARHFGLEGAGVGRVAIELYKGLIKQGHSVTCLQVQSDELVDYFKFTMFDIPRHLPKDADVYHAISPMEAIWLPKDRSVVTFHDLFLMTHPDKTGAGLGQSPLKRRIGEQYFKFACQRAVRCRFVTCNSEQTRDNIKNYLGAEAEIIKLGINPDLEPIPKKDSVLRFGYLGQLDRRKRVSLIVNAFHNSKLDAELVIAGRGSDRTILEYVADGDSRIKFIGFLPDENLSEFLNSLDYFLWPSALEGLSLPVLEAFACKRPVVTLWDAIIPQEIKSRTISVACFEALFENPLPRVNNLDDNYRFAKTYDWGECVDSYEKLYGEICSQT